MDFRRGISMFVFITVLANSNIVSVRIYGLYTTTRQVILCEEDTDERLLCRFNPNATIAEDLFNYTGRFTRLTSPCLNVQAREGSFNVALKNNITVRDVRVFSMMAQGKEIDIELVNSSAKLSITCLTNRSYSKVSSNIFKSSASSKDAMGKIEHADGRPHPWLIRYLLIVIHEQHVQSGHFTCRSIHEGHHTETIRIFTQTAASFDTSPFVPIRELTIQSDDDAGQGFIVPCRTNYRLQAAPSLLWAEHKNDTFSMLTAEEMKSFRWDPRVGFKFNSSERLWELKTLACRLGPYEKFFLPAPSRFMNLYLVKVEDNRFDCVIGQRNYSNKHLIRSELHMTEKRFHMCLIDVSCDLEWELGILEQNDKIMKPQAPSSMLSLGIFSCSFEHIYNNNRVPETSYKKFFVGLDSKIYLLPGSYPDTSVIQITQVHGPLYKYGSELYHEFACRIIDFVNVLDSASVEFTLRFKDKTRIVHLQNIITRSGLSSSVARFKVLLHSNITHVICHTLTNEGRFISAESPLQIIDASAPVVDNGTTHEVPLQVGDLNDNLTLTCPITGAPTPKYQWNFDEKIARLVTGNNTRDLKFLQIHEDLAGRYVCRAWNDYGQNYFEFEVSVLPQGFFSTLNLTTIAWIGVGTILGLLGLGGSVVSVLKYSRAKRQMRNLTPAEALEFLNGIPTSADPSAGQQGNGSELALRLPFTKRIEPNVLIVARDLILGKGQYGIVYRGFLHAEAVAVKAFKRAVTYDEFRAGLVEVKLMNFVGEHPNIVQFIGADVTNIEKRDILIVMELSPIGSLEKYLRELKTSTPPSYVNTESPSATADERLMLQKLFGFSEQIAFAMEYLESKNVIHGDLAVRNVLVFDHDVVKVTDFGYSRQLYENHIYKAKKHRSLPWRSASIELLRSMEFSSESDIWAFGVTVWEIFTFGNVPFANVRYSDQFVKSLEEGLRLEKPAGLCDSQYAFLMECWNVEKSERPRFSVLKAFFSVEHGECQ